MKHTKGLFNSPLSVIKMTLSQRFILEGVQNSNWTYGETDSVAVVGWGGVGGPCDYCVSPSPFGLDFGTLDFGTLDLGLTIKIW